MDGQTGEMRKIFGRVVPKVGLHVQLDGVIQALTLLHPAQKN